MHRALLIALLFATPALADGLTGKFTGDKLATEWAGNTGTIALGGKEYPATIQQSGDHFEGTFMAAGHPYAFTAKLEGDTLTLTSGTTTYTMANASTPANPLAAPSGADVPKGYIVLASTDGGKSLVTQKAGMMSVKEAFKATFPELATYFDTRPELGSAVEDAQSHRSGTATFMSKLAGKPVRGIVSCKLGATGGASIAVIYDRVDAPKSDWDKLANPTPSPSNQAANQAGPPDPATVLGPDAKVYSFPDGTGSILLAAGYTTDAQSATTPVLIKGPAFQSVIINGGLLVNTPDSQLVQTMKKNEEWMRSRGVQPAPHPPILIAPFTDPAQALTDLNPQLGEMARAKGLPVSRLDKIISTKEVPSALPNGKRAFVAIASTRIENGVSTKMRHSEVIDMSMTGQGVWSMFITAINAPEATFAKDRPILAAMLNSMSINEQVASQRMRESNQAAMNAIKAQGDADMAALKSRHEQYMQDQQTRFEIGQEQHAAQEAGYAQHNAQWSADELQKQRSAADFIETIKGTRTVVDTATGASGAASLSNVNGVVDALNQAALDPNRFVQIPLRDELYPVPAK